MFHLISPSAWLRHFFSRVTCFVTFYKASSQTYITNIVLKDVHDGNVWQDFLVNPLNPSELFLSNANNIALLLNVDWFKPFKH